MSHKFNPDNLAKLDNPERRKLLPPEESLHKLGFRPGQVVADIGCGTGYFSIPLARLVGEKGHVYGLDIVAQLVEEGRRRAQEARLANLTFLVSQENAVPLEDQQADAVLLAVVVHEIEDVSRFFQEVRRVLKPAGHVKIIEWKKEKMPMGPPVDHRIGADEMTRILKRMEFSPAAPIDLGPGHYGIVAVKDKFS